MDAITLPAALGVFSRLRLAWAWRRKPAEPPSPAVIRLLQEIARQGGGVDDSDPLLDTPAADQAIKRGLIRSGGAMQVGHSLTARGLKAITG